MADRLVQASLKLVLEPIFEAGFKPVSYGFRPKRRAQDAIAEIHYFATKGYHWVLEADIPACLDPWSYCSFADCAVRTGFVVGRGSRYAGLSCVRCGSGRRAARRA